MKKYSLYALVLCIFVILMVAVSISIYFSVIKYRQELIKTFVEEKISLAGAIATTISSPVWRLQAELSPAITRTLIEEAAKTKDIIYIRIVTSDGNINLSNIKEEQGKTIEDPDIARAIETEKPLVKDQIYDGEKIKTIIYPGDKNETIWVGLSLKSVQAVAKKILIRAIILTGGGLILIVLVIFLILRTIVDPLRKITLACKEARKGNLEIKIPVVSKTEIGELATAFNEMVKDLRESHAALEEAKMVLEIKVQARTRELRELAEGLEEEVKRRTAEIQERMKELERFQKLAVGRELKMIELKKEIEKLKEKLKEYESK